MTRAMSKAAPPRRYKVEFEMVEREEGYFSTKPELLELIKVSIERFGDLVVHKLKVKRVPGRTYVR